MRNLVSVEYEDSLSRSAALVCVPCLGGRHAAESGFRDAWARIARVHRSRVSARFADDAERRRQNNGRRLTGSYYPGLGRDTTTRL